MALTSDVYLSNVIAKYAVNEAGAKAQVELIYPVVQKWAGSYLIEAIYSGSIAKGTAVSLCTDADVFISLSSTTPDPSATIYTTLYNALTHAGYPARKQDVSIAVSAGGYKIDFVPGRRQSQFGYDHTLHKNNADSWTKTNVKIHVSHVAGSGRLNEIRLVKIWRALHGLDFPSFYLELAVIDCLTGSSLSALSVNFWKALGFLAGDFATRRYQDPANTNNIISDDLANSGKQVIKAAAQAARAQKTWQGIVW